MSARWTRCARVGVLGGIVLAAVPLAGQRNIPSALPIAHEPILLKLPRVEERTLPNGLTIMVIENHRSPIVNFELVVAGAGSLFDDQGQHGTAAATAALVGRTSPDTAARLEIMAASLTAAEDSSGADVRLSGSCLSGHFDTLMSIAAGAIMRPVFTDDQLQRHRRDAAAAVAQRRGSPEIQSQALFARMIYGDAHGAARILLPPDPPLALTREHLQAFHRAHYLANRSLLAVYGDVTAAQVTAAAARWLGDWTQGAPRPSPPPAAVAAIDTRPQLLVRSLSPQTTLAIGGRTPPLSHADYDALRLLNRIIGDPGAGRLFRRLREELGYTYRIASALSAAAYGGYWLTTTNVKREAGAAAVAEVRTVIARLQSERLSDDELAATKHAMLASIGRALESPAEALALPIMRWQHGLSADYWDRLGARIGAITPEQLQTAAQRYLSDSQLILVAVGDDDALAPLDTDGTAVRYDSGGARLPLRRSE